MCHTLSLLQRKESKAIQCYPRDSSLRPTTTHSYTQTQTNNRLFVQCHIGANWVSIGPILATGHMVINIYSSILHFSTYDSVTIHSYNGFEKRPLKL